jgi:ubiquitin C-terminal hydrolase
MDRTRLIYYTFLKKTLKKTSFIDEKLLGYFRASVTCAYNDCNYRSERFEPFFTLPLPIKGLNTLEECLANYVKPVTLDEKNKWFCEKCKRRSQAEKKMSIWTTAEYLIISYKRYVNLLINTVKDDRAIIAPFHELDLSPYVEDNKKDKNMYDLCAVTVHSGNMNNGHYVIARKVENNWVVFNDNTVVPVSENDINNGSAYYLVYKRR